MRTVKQWKKIAWKDCAVFGFGDFYNPTGQSPE